MWDREYTLRIFIGIIVLSWLQQCSVIGVFFFRSDRMFAWRRMFPMKFAFKWVKSERAFRIDLRQSWSTQLFSFRPPMFCPFSKAHQLLSNIGMLKPFLNVTLLSRPFFLYDYMWGESRLMNTRYESSRGSAFHRFLSIVIASIAPGNFPREWSIHKFALLLN